MKKQLKQGDKISYKGKEHTIDKVINEKNENKYICGYLKLTDKHIESSNDTIKPSSDLQPKSGQLSK